MNTEFDPYQNLANAIVMQAGEDYVRELLKLYDNPKDGAARLEASRIERFFHSGWYGQLTKVDPDQLLHGYRILAKREYVLRPVSKNKSELNKRLKEARTIFRKLNVQDTLDVQDQQRLKALFFEILSRAEKIRYLQKKADEIGNQALRRVGLQLR